MLFRSCWDLLCYASHFNLFFLRFLLYCKPHFKLLISLFISLITLWSHLFGTDPERETQYSCLSSCTIWSFQFRASGRGLQRSIRLLSCAGSRVAAASPTTELFLSLPNFCCVSSRVTVLPSHFFLFCTEYLHSTKNTIRLELMSFTMPSSEKGKPSTGAQGGLLLHRTKFVPTSHCRVLAEERMRNEKRTFVHQGENQPVEACTNSHRAGTVSAAVA